jgi:hypothetical protein
LIVPANRRFWTPEEIERLDRIRRASFFLLRNRRGGERASCGSPLHLRTPHSAPVYHEFLTRLCVPVPVDAVTAQAYSLVAVRARNSRERLSPQQVLDLATLHPRTARGLADDDAENVYALMLSDEHEPITVARAQEYADSIRARGGHDFTVQPLRRVAALRARARRS